MNFYNYTLDSALNISWAEYKSLIDAMIRIKARNNLQKFELNCVPKMESKDREKVRKRLYKQAFPQNFKKENIAKNLHDLVNKLRGGIGK